jgi:hypothetical protein
MYIDRMKRIDLYLTEPQIATFKKLSKKLGLSVAELIRRAADAFLEKQK